MEREDEQQHAARRADAAGAARGAGDVTDGDDARSRQAVEPRPEPRAVRALQEGRQGARQAVLPVRDVPRHGDEPRRRLGHRRARDDLEVDVVGPASRRAASGHPRPGVHGAGRSRHDELRAAPGLVLLLPLLSAPDLQVAGVGLPRHGRRADDRAHPADRAPVLRPAPRAAPAPPAGRGRRRGARRPLDGDARRGRARPPRRRSPPR